MIKFYSFLLVVAAIFLSGCTSAKQLIVEQEKADSWTGKVEFADEHARGKGPCFVIYGKYPTALMYKDYIPVDPEKTYVYKVNFRTLDPKLPASAYMGFELYDAQKRRITFSNVSTLGLEMSEVISARKGDKFMIIKPIKDYHKLRVFRIVFNAKNDMSDLPNYDLSPYGKTVTMNPDGNLLVEFKTPLVKDYAAGMKVRFHTPYSAPMYYLASGWMPHGEGKECTAVLKGIMTKAGAPKDKFWKGTKYIRPFIWFGNWNRKPQKGAKLLVDGMSLVVSE